MSRASIAIPVVAAERATPAMPSACASGGCGGATAPRRSPPQLAAFAPVRVNGIEIAPGAIAEEAQQHAAPDGASAWRAAARALVVREVLLQEARRLGILPEPECDEAGRREVDEEAQVRALLERQAPAAVPSEDECRRYYEAHRVRFRTPVLLEAAHILVAPRDDSDDAWRTAEADARTIAGQVGDDGEAFAAAAREFSTCSSAAQGGVLGQVRAGDLLAEVHEALAALREGTTRRDPVRTRFGWHVLRLERRIEGRDLPFEYARPRIADMLEARSWALAGARYAAALVAAARVEGVAMDDAVADAPSARS